MSKKGKLVVKFRFPKMDEYEEMVETTKDALSKYDCCKDLYEEELIKNDRLKKEIADLEAENDELAAENKRLRERLKNIKDNFTAMSYLVAKELSEKEYL